NKWVGMNGKPSMHHDEGCATGYVSVELAAQMVASGKYDIVLAGGVECANSHPIEGKPAHMRRPMGADAMAMGPMLDENVYTRHFGGRMGMDAFPSQYRLRNGLSIEEMDDTLNAIQIAARRNSAGNPRAYFQEDLETFAKKLGMSDMNKFMKSVFNPKVSEYIRKFGMELRTEGAAAAIVCSEEVAKSLKKMPIEILACTGATAEMGTPNVEEITTKEAIEELYAITGLCGDDIDLLMTNDFRIPSQLLTAEIAGYYPEGEGWKCFLNGDSAYDGRKPININGGRCAFGHAYAASGLADVFETVKQMRGESEGHQLPVPPKTVLVRGFGGGQNATAMILKA
ncbi:MAG: thiolase family protein, partial [Tyzzerella sp.]|nr:thiolase family protein [Tyzzerella sp.]